MTTATSSMQLTHSPICNVPVAAAQPIIGGMAPTTAPSDVLDVLRRFIGVYSAQYISRLDTASNAATALTAPANSRTPALPVTAAKLTACSGLQHNNKLNTLTTAIQATTDNHKQHNNKLTTLTTALHVADYNTTTNSPL